MLQESVGHQAPLPSSSLLPHQRGLLSVISIHLGATMYNHGSERRHSSSIKGVISWERCQLIPNLCPADTVAPART